ncbi:MAG: sodium:calcium antiporter [Chloroflexi bacterium]|nr:sodium:calcium antiporter [Chloroflexota bacterium]
MTLFQLLASMALVFVAAILFVNAIEYLGFHYKLGGSFVGAILSPLFTSFPELTVFLVAIFGVHEAAGEEIGIGTLFGQPFMASSMSYGLVGAAVLIGFLLRKRAKPSLVVDRGLAIPYTFITILFPLTLVPALFGGGLLKNVFGVLFLGSFIAYGVLMFRRKGSGAIEECAGCYLFKFGGSLLRGPAVAAFFQVAISVVMLYFGSKLMVGAVDSLATGLGMSALGLALIIVPAATAIPETASALIWGYRGKDTLALGSLVGEKILYSTFYPALGLFLTSWKLDRHAYFSVAATTIISAILLVFILKRKMPWWGLCLGLIFFISYAVLIFSFQF